MQNNVVIISGARSGFGALTARTLADQGDIVYAGIRHTTGRNATAVANVQAYAREHRVDLRPIEMDSSSQDSVGAAVSQVLAQQGRIDVLIHNTGHMVTGPTEAFTPEELAAVYDTNVLSAQRLNRAALPTLRAQGHGLVIWIGSSSTKGGTPPYLAPYFAAKSAMGALAVSYAAELARWGIETTIVVPGSFTRGTNHFANSGDPADHTLVTEYDAHYAGLMDQVATRLAALAPPDADATMVSNEIARIVALPFGTRPFRSHVDPVDDGSQRVSEVADQVREQFLTRIGLEDVLHPAAAPTH